MDQAMFEPFPVDEEFCILFEDEPIHEQNYERRHNSKRPKPNYFALYQRYESILMEKSIHSWPLPENMDQDTWMRFLRRMADAWKTCCLQHQTSKPWEIIVFGLPCALLFLSLFFMDLCNSSKKQENCNKNPPLWWIICMSAVVVSIVLLLKRMKKLFEAYTTEFRKSHEIVVKDM